ncbi:MAG: hypothetical protein J1F32_05865 [Erysipelotrichales bacterium]|nr:hypothetical protein [Erysipelotrichales bacterium]
MKKNSIILGLSLLLLSACDMGTSTSNSVSGNNSTSSHPGSTSASTPSSVTPSSTPSTSTSTGGTSSNSTNGNSSSVPEVAEKSIKFSAESLKESLPTSYTAEETLVTADGMELGFMAAKYGTYSNAGYIMLSKTSDTYGAGHIYNKTSLGHISSIVVKFSGSTSTQVVMGVTFGDEVMNEAKTTVTKSETATTNGVVTITNESETGDYFNISVTNDKNLQITDIVINLNGATETIS